ncbi:Oxalate--CoA ligase [Gracilariopsis chorda]|uniref:Oxalate--CoA ligase n=1 Tax=Gracilariopsis chorda TaxID=448386 RepID=A0A2V3IPA4_9FLOR|nr:Oxalate--CoA ligase [Gracilariopsis chorda]|eukprot:PXF43908.1 Oxalate--CoA ligase [Gracilariopsis chorda]
MTAPADEQLFVTADQPFEEPVHDSGYDSSSDFTSELDDKTIETDTTPESTPSTSAQAILDRLSRLEHSQQQMMRKLKSDHDSQMAVLRDKLEQAQSKRKYAEETALAQPLLMAVNMTEVEAAVQAASLAEQESASALEEARKVAEEARLASGGIPQSAREATKEGDVGYGADSEYIIKKVTVNLDEVERAISISSLISLCRAFGRPDPKYGNEVYCAVVPKKKVRVSERMLLIHAQKYLPTAMVPKRFFFLQDLPSGITRKALAEAQAHGDMNKLVGLPAVEQ